MRENGADQFSLVAGADCLDFVNTVGGLRGGHSEEYLATYADLVRWSEQVGLFSMDVADQLQREAERRPKEAHAVLERAIALREALYHILLAALEGARCADADLATLNGELAAVMSRMALEQTLAGFAWRWSGDKQCLDRTLGEIARSAAELLLAADIQALRQCASETCGWLFLDMTRNHSRRWCDMRGCGNREKVRRHRARQRSEAPA